MTNEEKKLLKLLQIAAKNGWESPLKTSLDRCTITPRKKVKLEYSLNPPVDSDEIWEFVNFNNLMSNWEKDEVSFIDALCKASHDWQLPQGEGHGFAIGERSKQDHSVQDWTDTYQLVGVIEWLRIQWSLQKTSEKINWLLNIFKHLLQ